MQTLQVNKKGIAAEETFLPPTPSANACNASPKIPELVGDLLKGGWKEAAKLKAELQLTEAMKPSEEWVKVGSGTGGKVYVEIISCDNLPNLDTPTITNPMNRTDAFCCLMMEDSIVNTSICVDNLSPRWMPTDLRAFVFHVHHPSSHLYIGVFDYSPTNRPFNRFRNHIHTPIGRVLINLTQLHFDTLYTLHYNLYEVSNDSAKLRRDQSHQGTITIRLRIKWDNRVSASMLPPPDFFVSVPKKHDFQQATYTIVGEVGPRGCALKRAWPARDVPFLPSWLTT
jgi:C2 domain